MICEWPIMNTAGDEAAKCNRPAGHGGDCEWSRDRAIAMEHAEMREMLRTLDGQFEEWQAGSCEMGDRDVFFNEDGTDLRAYWRNRIASLLARIDKAGT